MSRRRALRIGAVAAGSLTIGLDQVAGADEPRTGARDQFFDEGWRFFRGDATGAEVPSFDDSTWRTLDLPHDWSIEDLPNAPAPDGAITSDPSLLVPNPPPTQPVLPPIIGPFDPQDSPGDGSTADTIGGIGWYRKQFRLDTGDRHVEPRFDGVYQNADIWLNGTHLGFHPYGYTAFSFDVTPLLQPGRNVLAVRVDNSGKTSRWYSGSGIYRHTWLTVTGSVRIPLWGVSVTTPVMSAHNSVAQVTVSVTNLGAQLSTAAARVTVFDPRGHAVATRETAAQGVLPGATVVPSVDIPIDHTALWSTRSALDRTPATVATLGRSGQSRTVNPGHGPDGATPRPRSHDRTAPAAPADAAPDPRSRRRVVSGPIPSPESTEAPTHAAADVARSRSRAATAPGCPGRAPATTTRDHGRRARRSTPASRENQAP